MTPEQIRGAARQGRVEDAIYDPVLDPVREQRRVSAAQIEADGGLPAADIQTTLGSFGLPPPGADEPYFTEEEAEVFRVLGRLGELWPADARLQVSRVYGQALGRIAQTELHVFRSLVEPWLREVTTSPLDALTAVRQAFEWLLPLADPLLVGVHRRKLEQEMTQAAVWEVEREAEGLMPGTVEVSLLFCDLRHFTSYANRHGDAAAIEVLDRLGRAVADNLGANGRLVKSLGDGYMLAYPDPGSAVATALGVAAAMDEAESPPLHAGLHHGLAVFRDGDYYGRAVNLAARLLTAASANQLLATEDVVAATPERAWEAWSRKLLPGFGTSVEIFALDLSGGGSPQR